MYQEIKHYVLIRGVTIDSAASAVEKIQNLNVKTDRLTEHSQRHSTPASRRMPFKHKSGNA